MSRMTPVCKLLWDLFFFFWSTSSLKWKTSEEVRCSAAAPWYSTLRSPQQKTIGICVKYRQLIGTRCAVVWCKEEARGFFSPPSSLPFSFYLMCSSLSSLSVSSELKQIHQPLNKQELCRNDMKAAKGSDIFPALTSVFSFWLDSFLTLLLPLPLFPIFPFTTLNIQCWFLNYLMVLVQILQRKC